MSSFGDQYAFNDWLASGGSLKAALENAKVAAKGDVLDLSEFFESQASALSEEAEVLRVLDATLKDSTQAAAAATTSTCVTTQSAPHVPQILLQAGGTWRFFRLATAAPPDQVDLHGINRKWFESEYPATATGWFTGMMEPIGYGESFLHTVVSPNPFWTLYLRRQFTLTASQEPLNIGKVFLRTRYDDGFIAYLNGAQVLCINMPTEICSGASPLLYTSPASSVRESNEFEWFELDLSAHQASLNVGTNTLAVEVHNVSVTPVPPVPAPDPDLFFGLDPRSDQPSNHDQTDLLEGHRRGPFLTDTDNQSKSPWANLEIVWYTSGAVVGRVKYGTDPNLLISPMFASDTAASYEHRVVLIGLFPSTTYYYAAFNDLDNDGVEDTGEHYDTGSFRTVAQSNPAASLMPSFNFLVLGDAGCTDLGGGCMQDQVRNFIQGLPTCPDFVLYPGDIVYENGELGRVDTRHYVPYQNLVSRMPFFLCPGNHDVQEVEGNKDRRNYFASYVLPENTSSEAQKERYYSFDYGNIHFVALDTTTPAGNADICDEKGPPTSPFLDSAQVAWLCQDLANARRFWKIVYMHHPAYTSSFITASLIIQNELTPIFDLYKVDLVLQAHAHLYERTVRIFQNVGKDPAHNLVCSFPSPLTTLLHNTRNPDFGTIYLTTGGGGKDLVAKDILTPTIPSPIIQSDVLFDSSCTSTPPFTSAFHVIQITSTRDTLTIEPKNKDGVALEVVSLQKDFPKFKRGDANGDGTMDISDAVFITKWLFSGGEPPNCLDAADPNDSGKVDVSDSIYILSFLFSGGPPPHAPFPNCGMDTTVDDLSCEYYAGAAPCEAPLSATCVGCPQ